MTNSGLLDYSRTQLEATDTIVMNERTRYSFASASVNGGTISPNPNGTNWFAGTGITSPTSAAKTASWTVTAFDISKGIVVYTSTSAGFTATLDTATNIVAMVNAQSAGAMPGDVLSLLVVNGGTTAFGFAPGSGGSNDTNIATGSIGATSSRFCYIRLNNTTNGTESYTVYF